MFRILLNGAPSVRVRAGIISIFLVGSLASCAGTTSGAANPDASAARTTSDVASRAPGEQPAAAGDQRLSSTVLERTAFVRAVLKSNPTLESARQSVLAARARIRQAGVFEDPMVEVGVAPLSIVSSNAPFGYEVMISQKLPWFGKRALESSIASAEAEAARSDYESMRRELAFTAVTLYDQYFVATRSLEINAQHIELMQAMKAGATAQFETGRGSAQDPLQAEAELAHMEHDAVKLRSQREVTVAQMNELLHRPPELALPPPPAELPRPDKARASSATRLDTDTFSRRSEIRAAREHARAEQARADRADRDAYPDFSVSASYNSMWDMPEHRFMLGLGFNLPIQGSRRQGMRDEALANRAQFESQVAQLTDAARRELFVATKELEESRHVLELFETRLLPVARDQIDAARAGFTASRNPFMAVIEAEKNLRAIELDYQMARAEYDGRSAALERAFGRIPGLDAKEVSR
jgi:cobalt-zinc-cadmium efflux system outer membrane protein